MPTTTADNNFGVAKWIVSATEGQGTHTTIASALTSASAGDTIFIRTGSYSENITLKAGVDLCSFSSEDYTANVTIIGAVTATFTGTVSISGIRFQDNAATEIVTASGSQQTNLNFSNCYFITPTKSALNITNSNASSVFNVHKCLINNTGSGGLNNYAKSGASVLNLYRCILTGSNGTNNSCSGGSANLYHCIANVRFNSSTGNSSQNNLFFCSCAAGNNSVFTSNSTGGASSNVIYSRITTGAGVSVTIGTGASANIFDSDIDSTNATPITETGTGSLVVTPFTFTNTSFASTVPNITDRAFGRSSTWTPVVTFGGGNTGLTFTTAPTGKYWVVGQMTYFNLFFQVLVVGSSTGNFQVTLPSTSANDSSAGFTYPCNFSGTGVTFPASTTQVIASVAPNTNFVIATGIGDTGVSTQITDANFSTAAFFSMSGFYWTA
jgi:hypothetical protein